MGKEKISEATVNEVLGSRGIFTENNLIETPLATDFLQEENAGPVDQEEVEVFFIVSPTGKFGLAYNVGEKGFFNSAQAIELVESGYAEFVTE